MTQSGELPRTITGLDCMRLCLQIDPCHIDKHIGKIVFSGSVVVKSTVVHITQGKHRVQSFGFGEVRLLVLGLFLVLCGSVLCAVPRLLVNPLQLHKL
jgi:hypothetical protein